MSGQNLESWKRHHAAVPKGFLRFHVLRLLEKHPMSGAEIASEIEKMTGGLWKPLPGSIYPLLQYLKREGYIKEAGVRKGLKRYSLTEKGRHVLQKLKKLRPSYELPPPFVASLCAKLPSERVGEFVKVLRKLAQAILDAAERQERIEEVLKILENAADKMREIVEA